MRKACLDHAIELANSKTPGPFAQVAKGAMEVGVIVPSILKKLLTEAGYVIKYVKGPRDDAEEGAAPKGAWVRVYKDDLLVARALSHDEADALLQAIYAEMKEEAKVKEEVKA